MGSGAGLVLCGPDGYHAEYALRFGFVASNNQAEYEAVLKGLEIAIAAKIKRIKVHTDSQLVAKQINSEYEAKDPTMLRYLQKYHSLAPAFEEVLVQHLLREDNQRADALSRLASSGTNLLGGKVMMEFLERPSVDPGQPVLHTKVADDPTKDGWMTAMIRYLKAQVLPENDKEAWKLIKRSESYILDGDTLLRKSRSGSFPLMRCLSETDSREVLREIHEGACGNHAGGRSLAHKALRLGYYWPTMEQDAADYARKCDKCQRFAGTARAPATHLTPIISPVPFAQWGMDIVGPFPPATGNRRYILLLTDYFTKWIEAEAMAKITAEAVKKFLWRNILCRFGIPRVIVTDNGPQFDCKQLREFGEEHGIDIRYASVAYPRANGQAEASNKTILKTLQKKLNHAKGRWADELPAVLWAYRTTEREATGATPFSLAFGAEAVIPTEVKVPTPRLLQYDGELNDEGLALNLELIDESRDRAATNHLIYRQRMARYHDRRVRGRALKVGDLAMRKADITERNPPDGKLAPPWEGPYKVTEVVRPGTYRLERLDGTTVPRTWNMQNLRKYDT